MSQMSSDSGRARSYTFVEIATAVYYLFSNGCVSLLMISHGRCFSVPSLKGSLLRTTSPRSRCMDVIKKIVTQYPRYRWAARLDAVRRVQRRPMRLYRYRHLPYQERYWQRVNRRQHEHALCPQRWPSTRPNDEIMRFESREGCTDGVGIGVERGCDFRTGERLVAIGREIQHDPQ